MFFNKLLNNKLFSIIFSVILVFASLLIFKGDMRMFVIVCEVLAIAMTAIIVMGVGEKDLLWKAIIIATIGGLIFGIVLGLICGIELYPDTGACGICGGGGVFQGKPCPNCSGGW